MKILIGQPVHEEGITQLENLGAHVLIILLAMLYYNKVRKLEFGI